MEKEEAMAEEGKKKKIIGTWCVDGGSKRTKLMALEVRQRGGETVSRGGSDDDSLG